MPTISGSVLFDSNRASNGSGTAISNVPVILKNTTTGVGLVVLTSSTGAYSFTNVPAGTYTIVEGFGTTGGIPTPGDFSTAVVIPNATPNDPPVSSVTSPPAGTNVIDSLTPNTINATVISSNLTAQNFIDAPRKDIPFIVNDISLSTTNLITSANNGNWGTLPAGSPINSIPPTEPYPGVAPNFTYVAGSPAGSQYTVDNIAKDLNSSWWNFANHTTGDETGRFEVINGAPAGYKFFSQTVSVTPNSTYLFSAWFANMVKINGYPAGPGVTISTPSGSVIFTTGASNIPASSTILAWYEIGSLFNSGNNTSLIVSFQDVNGGASGNDYAADDFSLVEATVNNILAPITKVVDKTDVQIGATLTYTVTFSNSGLSTAQNVTFLDTIPNGTSFVANSLSINGVSSASNPNPPGVSIPNIVSGASTTIVYKVIVTTIPVPNPIPNSATVNYSYAPVVGQTATVPIGASSNIVYTSVNKISLTPIIKTVNKSYATVGDILTYTLAFTNTGTQTAINVIFLDTIPIGTSFISNSLFVNGNLQTASNPAPPGVTIPDIPVGQLTTITFNVLVNTIPTPNPTTNQAKLTSSSSSITIPQSSISNVVSTTINYSNLASSKTVNSSYGNIGSILTYTLPIKNLGNATAYNINFLDTIPSGTTLLSNSFKQNGVLISGNPNPPGVSLSSIEPYGTSTITFQVLVNTIPNPNPILNSASTTFNYLIDGTTSPNVIGTGSSNTNIVSTFIGNANLGGIVKNADKSFADCGDIILYTIVIPNTGNVTAQNIIFKDTIPNGTTFVSNSVIIDGVSYPGINPSTGITIPDIPGFGVSTLTFNVIIHC